MLRITAKQQLMREIVDILSVLTPEAKLVWGEKGLSISVVDGSHVALLSATIADECFETYEVEPVEIGLDLQKMRDLLTLAGGPHTRFLFSFFLLSLLHLLNRLFPPH